MGFLTCAVLSLLEGVFGSHVSARLSCKRPRRTERGRRCRPFPEAFKVHGKMHNCKCNPFLHHTRLFTLFNLSHSLSVSQRSNPSHISDKQLQSLPHIRSGMVISLPSLGLLCMREPSTRTRTHSSLVNRSTTTPEPDNACEATTVEALSTVCSLQNPASANGNSVASSRHRFHNNWEDEWPKHQRRGRAFKFSNDRSSLAGF